jgi:hypothetical protein
MTTLNELVNTANTTTVANPLDVATGTFAAALQRRTENRNAIVKLVKEALVDGTDYGSVKTKHGMSRPSLRKAGAEKICGMLGLSVHYPGLSKYEDAAVSGVEIKQIIIRCELRDGSGNLMADGIGARLLAQDNGDLNKALKMAAKSAQIDATLRCAGLSEVFTQDLEDMIITQETHVTPTQEVKTTQTTAETTSHRLLSDKQVARLHVIMRQHGIVEKADTADFIARMKAAYNISEPAEMTREQYEQVCNITIPAYAKTHCAKPKEEYKPYGRRRESSDDGYDAMRDAGCFDGERRREMYGRN